MIEIINMFIKNNSPQKAYKNQRPLPYPRKTPIFNRFTHLGNASQIGCNIQNQLKSKIIKAILSNNETIKKQIQYKRSASTAHQRKSSNFKLQLNFKQRPGRYERSVANQPQISALNLSSKSTNNWKCNTELEVQNIMGPNFRNSARLSLNSSNLKLSASGSSSRPLTHRKIHKNRQEGGLVDTSQFLQIMPWSYNLNDKEFQYF